ncbi:MAG: class I SAM-dependent methyltransferase [Bacillota bacterium]|nr:class I SAM-dependent methyltransferase [Bacillota bacterium]
MSERFENPSLLFRIEDELLNNRLGGFVYKKHIAGLGLKGSEKILDFGSGSGAGSKHLAKLLAKGGGQLTCVDISSILVNKAKKRMRKYNNVDYKVGKLEELDIPSNSHDAIYIFYVLHDVDKDLRQGIVKELFRILKDDGKLYIGEPHKKNHGMPASEIRDLMKEAGFEELQYNDLKSVYKAVFMKSNT